MPVKSSSKPPAKKAKKEVAKPQEDEDPDLAMSESEGEEDGSGDEDSGEEYEESEEEEESDEDDADDDEDTSAMTPEELAEHKAGLKRKAETRRKTKVRRRGLRKVATLAGFSSKFVSDHPDRDVATPVLSLSETIRAAKWAPKLAHKPAFEGLEEFKERTELAYNTSLPPGAAKVLQDNGEIFLRRLVLGAVQRQADMARTSTTAAMVAAETRPLRRALKYSFVGTDLKGLVRYAQTAQPGEKLNMFDGELNDIEDENRGIVEDQKEFNKGVLAEVAAKKKELADKAKSAEQEAAGKGAAEKQLKKKKKTAAAI